VTHSLFLRVLFMSSRPFQVWSCCEAVSREVPSAMRNVLPPEVELCLPGQGHVGITALATPPAGAFLDYGRNVMPRGAVLRRAHLGISMPPSRLHIASRIC